MKKIRVVFIDYQLVVGGAEQALFDLINLLDKDKFQVSVFVQCPGGPWDQKFLDAGIELIYEYSCRKPTWNPITKLGNLRKKLLVKKALKQGGAGLLDICCPGTDIIVDYSAWCCPEISFAKGARSVKYIHGDPATNAVYREEAETDTERLKRFQRIVCVSQAAVESFRRYSGLTSGVRMYYNPLDSEQVRKKAEAPVELPDDAPLICAVGRLSEEKGFERLIYIHKRLLDRGILHKVVLVGDGPDRGFIERMIKMTGTEDSVILAGYQSNPYPYMKRSRFLVNASYTEGLPVIAMECLSLGIPIVAPVPSVGEAFGDELCGIITENDTPSLEAGIEKMLTDGAFYAEAKAGAERRSSYFDGNRMVQEVEAMFLELMRE